MEKYELPLVFFTVLSQMSVGMALVLTWRTLRGEVEGQRFYWLATGWCWHWRLLPRFCIWRIPIALIMR